MIGYEPKRVAPTYDLFCMMMISVTYALFITFENGLVYDWIYHCPHALFVTNFKNNDSQRSHTPFHSQFDILNDDLVESRSSLTKTLLSFEKLKPFCINVEKQVTLTMDNIHDTPVPGIPFMVRPSLGGTPNTPRNQIADWNYNGLAIRGVATGPRGFRMGAFSETVNPAYRAALSGEQLFKFHTEAAISKLSPKFSNSWMCSSSDIQAKKFFTITAS